MSEPQPLQAYRALDTPGPRCPAWLWAAVLIALVAFVYLPTLDNGFIWDDDVYVEGNPTLRSAEGLRDIWLKIGATPQYYPLVHTSFWLEAHAWGIQPRGYHVVNMLLHTVCVLLAWRLLSTLSVPGAWLAAALFAVHPVEVESVAWVTERKNVLSCALALSSMLAYLRFAPADTGDALPTAPTASRWFYYALAWLLYVAALFSKTVTASVPAVLLVLTWWKRGTVTRRDVLRLIPFFIVGIASGSLTVWMERAVVGATGDDWTLSPIERLLVVGRALWFYAGKLAWPSPLIFFYPRWTIDAGAWWQYLYPAAALVLLVVLWKLRARIGRGPLAAVLIFAGVLVPALGFFNVFPFRYSFVADHFQYHASIALIALTAAGLVLALRALTQHAAGIALMSAAVAVVPLAVLARQQTSIYHDGATLYEETLALNPTAWIAHLNLGVFLIERGEYQSAVDHYREALRLNSHFPSLHVSLATALHLAGDTDEAYAELDRGLASNMPDYEQSIAQVHYAIMLEEQRRYAEAIEHCKTALKLRPDYADALYHYGTELAASGDVLGGIEKIRQSLAISADSPLAQNALGNLLFQSGQIKAALPPLRAAVRLQGNLPKLRDDLAAALLDADEPGAAEDQLRQALAIHAASARSHFLLGRALLARGDVAGAIYELDVALRIDPRLPGAAEALRKARAAAR